MEQGSMYKIARCESTLVGWLFWPPEQKCSNGDNLSPRESEQNLSWESYGQTPIT